MVSFVTACFCLLVNLFLFVLACNRGAVVCFLDEGQVGCVTEDKLLGESQVPDSIVQVRWSDKECYKARVIFFGNKHCIFILNQYCDISYTC